jgi:hypothetical protein
MMRLVALLVFSTWEWSHFWSDLPFDRLSPSVSFDACVPIAHSLAKIKTTSFRGLDFHSSSHLKSVAQLAVNAAATQVTLVEQLSMRFA